MTRDEIAQAMQDTAGYEWGNEAHFQRFAAIVEQRAAAAEREECAKVCYLMASALSFPSSVGWYFAKAIRARGET